MPTGLAIKALAAMFCGAVWIVSLATAACPPIASTTRSSLSANPDPTKTSLSAPGAFNSIFPVNGLKGDG